MPELSHTNGNAMQDRGPQQRVGDRAIHPAWLRLMRFCSELGHGEIAKLKIQDGLPVIADVTTRKVKFNS